MNWPQDQKDFIFDRVEKVVPYELIIPEFMRAYKKELTVGMIAGLVLRERNRKDGRPLPLKPRKKKAKPEPRAKLPRTPKATRTKEPKPPPAGLPPPKGIQLVKSRGHGQQYIAETIEPPGAVPNVLSLGELMCKWLIGDPSTIESTFRGRPRHEKYPYCVSHCWVAYPELRQGYKKLECVSV